MSLKKISIPSSGLVATPDTIDQAFDRAKQLLTGSAHHKTQRLQRVFTVDVLTALQMIQNTLSENYEVFSKDGKEEA